MDVVVVVVEDLVVVALPLVAATVALHLCMVVVVVVAATVHLLLLLAEAGMSSHIFQHSIRLVLTHPAATVVATVADEAAATPPTDPNTPVVITNI